MTTDDLIPDNYVSDLASTGTHDDDDDAGGTSYDDDALLSPSPTSLSTTLSPSSHHHHIKDTILSWDIEFNKIFINTGKTLVMAVLIGVTSGLIGKCGQVERSEGIHD